MSKLREAVSSTSTILPILGYIAQGDFPAPGIVTIESETIRYSGTTDKELTGCTRGYNGTSAAAHVLESDVTFVAEEPRAHGLDLQGSGHDIVYSGSEMRFSNGSYITVSGDTVVFHNSDDSKTFTITMI